MNYKGYPRDYRVYSEVPLYEAYCKINGVNVLSRLSKIIRSRKHTDTGSASAIIIKINMNYSIPFDCVSRYYFTNQHYLSPNNIGTFLTEMLHHVW